MRKVSTALLVLIGAGLAQGSTAAAEDYDPIVFEPVPTPSAVVAQMIAADWTLTSFETNTDEKTVTAVLGKGDHALRFDFSRCGDNRLCDRLFAWTRPDVGSVGVDAIARWNDTISWVFAFNNVDNQLVIGLERDLRAGISPFTLTRDADNLVLAATRIEQEGLP